jgi:hypothetical protein
MNLLILQEILIKAVTPKRPQDLPTIVLPIAQVEVSTYLAVGGTSLTNVRLHYSHRMAWTSLPSAPLNQYSLFSRIHCMYS